MMGLRDRNMNEEGMKGNKVALLCKKSRKIEGNQRWICPFQREIPETKDNDLIYVMARSNPKAVQPVFEISRVNLSWLLLSSPCIYMCAGFFHPCQRKLEPSVSSSSIHFHKNNIHPEPFWVWYKSPDDLNHRGYLVEERMKREKRTSHCVLPFTGFLLSSCLPLCRSKTKSILLSHSEQLTNASKSFAAAIMKPLGVGAGEESCRSLLSTNNCQCFLPQK